MRRVILINLARMLWRLAHRLTHYANALFNYAYRRYRGRDDR